MKRKLIAALVGAALGIAPAIQVSAQQKGGGPKLSDGVVKIGVLTDLSEIGRAHV